MSLSYERVDTDFLIVKEQKKCLGIYGEAKGLLHNYSRVRVDVACFRYD